jgi:spermidine synthase
MPVFALTIFLGAFLLFQVQPLIGKFILPWFGGSPAVWTTCLLFFQVVLLAGYAYAHLSARHLPSRAQAVLHSLLVLGALALLPIVPGPQWKPASPEYPTGRILLLLCACVGGPFFVLSATAPLLQAWFGQVRPGVAPYRLYALSNAGSLLALLSYPFVFEPAFSRQTQAHIWAWGLGLYAGLMTVCAARLWSAPAKGAHGQGSTGSPAKDNAPPSFGTRTLWLGLPACASVLLMSTTNKVCQDVAVVPFLWVLPLSLYLLSFILCFDSPQWYGRGFFHLALIPAIGAVCLALFEGVNMPLPVQIGIYTAGLFVCCMVCHGELFRLRPHPRYLTAYYLTLAAGGALGGLFVAVVAPRLFESFFELHWGLVLCALLLMTILQREKKTLNLAGRSVPAWECALVGACVLAVLLFLQGRRAGRNVVARARNFYGVIRVFASHGNVPQDEIKVLRVGEIIHGMQFTHATRAPWAIGYHSEDSGVGLGLRHLIPPPARRIGVLGLGVGTLAAYGQPGDSVRFYEINPAVRDMAASQFAYLRLCRARVEVVLGDGRLSLEREPSQQLDLLALDAFNSDAVPVHLLTKEACATYLRHLRPDGVLAVHITNRHLDLWPVVQNLAAHFQLQIVSITHKPQAGPWWVYPTRWVLLTRNANLFQHAAIQAAAGSKEEKLPRVPLWTDDYASLFKVLR